MAVDMFIKIGDIKGEAVDKATEKNHADEITVRSWHWGMSQQGSSHHGSGAGTGRADVQDLSFTHYIDLATPNLIKFCCMGKHFPEALLTLRKSGTALVEYMKIAMKDVTISGVTTGTPGEGDLLTETVSLHFTKFQVDYTSQKATGAPDKTVVATWDIAGNVEKIA